MSGVSPNPPKFETYLIVAYRSLYNKDLISSSISSARHKYIIRKITVASKALDALNSEAVGHEGFMNSARTQKGVYCVSYDNMVFYLDIKTHELLSKIKTIGGEHRAANSTYLANIARPSAHIYKHTGEYLYNLSLNNASIKSIYSGGEWTGYFRHAAIDDNVFAFIDKEYRLRLLVLNRKAEDKTQTIESTALLTCKLTSNKDLEEVTISNCVLYAVTTSRHIFSFSTKKISAYDELEGKDPKGQNVPVDKILARKYTPTEDPNRAYACTSVAADGPCLILASRCEISIKEHRSIVLTFELFSTKYLKKLHFVDLLGSQTAHALNSVHKMAFTKFKGATFVLAISVLYHLNVLSIRRNKLHPVLTNHEIYTSSLNGITGLDNGEFIVTYGSNGFMCKLALKTE